MKRQIVFSLLVSIGLCANKCFAIEYEDLPLIYAQMTNYAAQAGADGSCFFLKDTAGVIIVTEGSHAAAVSRTLQEDYE